jgi:hypothetical protein
VVTPRFVTLKSANRNLGCGVLNWRSATDGGTHLVVHPGPSARGLGCLSPSLDEGLAVAAHMTSLHVRQMQEATLRYMFKDVDGPPKELATKLIEMLNCLRSAPGLASTVNNNKIYSTFYTAEKTGDGKAIVDAETATDRARGLLVYNPNEESFMNVVLSLIEKSTSEVWEKWQLDLARVEYPKRARHEGLSQADVDKAIRDLKVLQARDRGLLDRACQYIKQHASNNYWVIPFSNALISLSTSNPKGDVGNVEVRYYIKIDAQGCMNSGEGQKYERQMLLLHIAMMKEEHQGKENIIWRMVAGIYMKGKMQQVSVSPMDHRGLLPDGAKKFLEGYLGRMT